MHASLLLLSTISLLLMVMRLMPLWGLVHVSLAASLVKCSPPPILGLMDFTVFVLLPPFVSVEQSPWCGASAVWGRETGSKATYPYHASPLPSVRSLHSISLLCTCPDELALGHRHSTQTTMVHLFVWIVSLISSSTPNLLFPSLGLPPTHP